MSWLPDEVDYGYSSIDESELERRPCGLHPKPRLPPPPPPVTDLTPSGVKMLRNIIALASSTVEWEKGVFFGTFAFTDQASEAKAKALKLDTPQQVLNHCLDRIDKGTHPDFDTLSWNTDQFIKKVKIDHILAQSNAKRVPLPALMRVQPLADLKAHPAEAWTTLTADEAQHRSQLWRRIITMAPYTCRSPVLLFLLVCAPKAKFVKLAEFLFDLDNDNWYDRVVENCLGSYGEWYEQDAWRVREIFEEVTALLHAQDVDVEVEY